MPHLARPGRARSGAPAPPAARSG